VRAYHDRVRVAVLAVVTVLASVLIGSAPGATPGTRSAQQLVLGLRAAGLPIGKIKVYTAPTDGNHLLGRPGQYTGKVSFHDRRIQDGAGGYSVSSGGSLEVFATSADARRRAAFVSSIFESASQAVPSERDYVRGNVFLRLSYVFTPAQARAYVAALRRLA
jgi:hypothetical protein